MKYFISIITSFFITYASSSQVQPIDSMMKVYGDKFPQQKVYVHFDKGVYRAGETMWFKAYIFAGFTPALNSKSFYAELIDNAGNVVQRKVYPVVEGSAAGNFDIPENQSASHFKFRGYTSWMMNFDTSFLYTKNIGVAGKNGATPIMTTAQKIISLRFFPEGGDLINTLQSVVAFKANDNYGDPVNVSGSIKNSKGEVVTSFKSHHDGMGTFKIVPEINEIYSAVYTDDAGVERTAALPPAKTDGATLEISSTPTKAVFMVKRPAGETSNYKNVHVVAHIAQQLVYKAKVPLQRSAINSGSFLIDKHPSGILQFTLFSEDWTPLAERILLINNDDYRVKADVKPVTLNVNKRAENVFEVEVEDTLLANLSVSVTDVDITEEANSENIISRLLLTGDLKGYVHNPSYYFSDKQAAKNVDLVMLTNGWRRYNWQDVVQQRTPVIRYADTSYISLTAKVFGIPPNSPLRKDESINAVIQGRDSGTTFIELPKTGPDVFSLPNVLFYDTVSVFYQFSKNRKLERKATVQFDNGLYKGYKKINTSNLPLVSFSASDSALARTKFLANQIIKFGSSWEGRGNVLETVTVKTKVRSALEILDKKYASGMFTGDNGYAFDFINNDLPIDIFTFLQSRVPGLRINRSGMDVSIEWRNSPTAVFINEMSSVPDMLTSISVNDIAYVKVFRPPFFGAAGGGGGGAIAVYTRRGGDEPSRPGNGLAVNQVAGYSPYKEFYSPDYSTRSGSADVVADYRSTLYWNPFILTEKEKQKVTFKFFNNDVTKAFRVVLEGVNEEGKLIRVEKVMQ